MSGLHKIIAPYCAADNKKGLVQLLNSLLPFLGLCVLSFILYTYNHFLPLLIAVPAALFLLRVFIIQHDCGHGSFFKSQKLNDWTGRLAGMLTFTPYTFWKKQHAYHHATNGNLSKRGAGDISTMTVREYLNANWFQRMNYRLYRNPIFLFFVGGPLLFIVVHRFPYYLSFRQIREWISVLLTDVVLAGVLILFTSLTSFMHFVVVYLPIIFIAGVLGSWLFYLQHQFEDGFWEWEEDWDYYLAALKGSSFYKLPGILNWFTGSIGYHHIHHLSSKIPNYKLKKCFVENPELKPEKTLTLKSSLACMRLALWDEESRKMVPFSHLKKIR